jgi:hypothetical protein
MQTRYKVAIAFAFLGVWFFLLLPVVPGRAWPAPLWDSAKAAWSATVQDLPGPQGPAGPPGPPGQAGAGWYTSTGAPATGGVDGDFCLNTSDGSLWQKYNGSWSLVYNISAAEGATGPAELEGPPGPMGPEGPQG